MIYYNDELAIKLGKELHQALERVKELESHTERLANYIMAEVPGEPSEPEGAVDCAIRVMKQLRTRVTELEAELNSVCVLNFDLRERVGDAEKAFKMSQERVKELENSDSYHLLMEKLMASNKRVKELEALIEMGAKPITSAREHQLTQMCNHWEQCWKIAHDEGLKLSRQVIELRFLLMPKEGEPTRNELKANIQNLENQVKFYEEDRTRALHHIERLNKRIVELENGRSRAQGFRLFGIRNG